MFVFDIDGNKGVMTIAGSVIMEPMDGASFYPHEQYLVICYTNEYQSRLWRIYDENANPITDEILGYINFDYMNDIEVIISNQSSIYYNYRHYQIYDLEGNILLPDIFIDVTPINNYLMVRDDEPAGSPARILYNWIQSTNGQSLVKNEGYATR